MSLALTSFARAASEDSKERAARKACLSGNVQKGVELLSDLFVTTENPVFIYNQGRCFEQNGRYEEAVNRFREYLRKAKNISAEDKADADKHIADCQALALGKTTPSAPNATPGAPSEAAPVQTPEATYRPPLITAGQAVMPPLGTAPSTVVVPAPSAQPRSNPDEVAASPGLGLRVAGIACATVGFGAVATAIYFYTRARSYSDKVSNQDVPSSSDESAGKNAETMQWVFYGVGGAAIGTGVLLYALGARMRVENVSLVPLVGSGLAGLSAEGSF